MKILLLEPDRIFARNYIQSLEMSGHEVTWCSTAQAAIHAADESVPDLIILEPQMPMHNGVEFLYELRSYPEWQQIPVVILSLVPAAAMADDMEPLRRLGVVKCLFKPRTKLRQLRQAVDQIGFTYNEAR